MQAVLGLTTVHLATARNYDDTGGKKETTSPRTSGVPMSRDQNLGGWGVLATHRYLLSWDNKSCSILGSHEGHLRSSQPASDQQIQWGWGVRFI